MFLPDEVRSYNAFIKAVTRAEAHMPDARPLLRERLDALTDFSSLTDTELWQWQ